MEHFLEFLGEQEFMKFKMTSPKFILSKKVLKDQVKILEDLGLKVSYSYKTNREVGKILQNLSDCDFSIHEKFEIDEINDKKKIWFFTQAENKEELEDILKKGVRNFVVDNEIDLNRLLEVVEKFNSQFCSDPVPTRPTTPSELSKNNSQNRSSENLRINLSLRMKFQEHRVGTGKYFVYGMSSKKVNELILKINGNENIEKLGIHVHRKSQNTSEWEIKEELVDSLNEECLNAIDFVNFGGGLPSVYKSYSGNVYNYIFEKIGEGVKWLNEKKIECYIEPGRFLAAPCVKLETEIIQVYEGNIVINVSIYNCALDCVLTNTKMLIEGELEEGECFLIKGNSPTRDDIFRYRVKLDSPKVGDKIVFLNAGAYNYATDFFGYKKLETEVV
jgi:ornithine decarboxylase